jgi:hypothetical protein
MVNWAGIAEGMTRRRDENLRSRREMAEAFALFRANNPYATAEEFQSFIDSYSGGRNYIAGGAPSGDILRRIGLENQRRRAEDERARRLESIRQRTETVRLIQGLADEALLGMQGDDFASARDAVVAQFGEDGAALLADFDINGMFTPGRRDRLVGQQVRENLPAALDILRASDGQLTSADLARAFPDLPRAILDPLAEEAKRVHEQERADQERARALEIANTETAIRDRIKANPDFLAAIRRGDKATIDRIIGAAVGPYAPIFGEEVFGTEFRASLIDEAQASAENEQIARHQTLFEEGRTRATEAATTVEQRARDAVIGTFRVSENGDLTELTGQAGAKGLIAAQELARLFDTSDARALNALVELFATEEAAGLTIDELIQAGASALQAAGVPTREAAKLQATMLVGPVIPEMMSFPQWRQRAEEDIARRFADVHTDIAAARRITDPDQLQGEITRLATTILTRRQELQAEIAAARANADLWVPVGEAGWDESQVSGEQGSVKATLEAELRALDGELRTLAALQGQLVTQAGREQAAQAALVARAGTVTGMPAPIGPPPPVPPVTTMTLDGRPATGLSLSDSMTGFQRTVQSFRDEAAAQQALMEAAHRIGLGQAGLPGSTPILRAWDYFTAPTDDPEGLAAQRTEGQALSRLLQEPEALEFLLANPQTAGLLQSDPVAWGRMLDQALRAARTQGGS